MNEQLNYIYSLFIESTGVSTDTRNIKHGCIFFCLKGENFNANKFAIEALEKGASYVIADEKIFDDNNRIILVDNALNCLQNLAHFHRKHFKFPFIGITGTNGKTTTKELVATALSVRYKVHSTYGNLNNHIGVPLTLLSIPEDTEIAIIEMGANHPGEIAFLSSISEPDYGLITNIGKAHLEGFGGYEGVKKTKRELYEFIEKEGKGVFVNGDDALLMQFSEHIPRITYGQGTGNNYVGNSIPSDSFLTLSVENKQFKTNLLGEYNFPNFMAAYAIAVHFGAEPDKVVEALKSYQPSNKRSQMLKTERNTVYLDAYNANPTSMAAAIGSFMASPNKQQILILGDMLELGNESLAEHQSIVDLLVEHSGIQVILIGPEFAKTNKPDNYMSYIDTTTARNYLKEHIVSENYILLKGSRGIGLEKLIDLL